MRDEAEGLPVAAAEVLVEDVPLAPLLPEFFDVLPDLRHLPYVLLAPLEFKLDFCGGFDDFLHLRLGLLDFLRDGREGGLRGYSFRFLRLGLFDSFVEALDLALRHVDLPSLLLDCPLLLLKSLFGNLLQFGEALLREGAVFSDEIVYFLCQLVSLLLVFPQVALER